MPWWAHQKRVSRRRRKIKIKATRIDENNQKTYRAKSLATAKPLEWLCLPYRKVWKKELRHFIKDPHAPISLQKAAQQIPVMMNEATNCSTQSNSTRFLQAFRCEMPMKRASMRRNKVRLKQQQQICSEHCQWLIWRKWFRLYCIPSFMYTFIYTFIHAPLNLN